MQRAAVLAAVNFFFTSLRRSQRAFPVYGDPRLQTGFELIDALQARAYEIDRRKAARADLFGSGGNDEGVGSSHIYPPRCAGSLSLWERARVREHTDRGATTATALTLTLSRYAGEGKRRQSPYASVSSSSCTRIPSGSRRKALLKFPSGVLVTVGGTTKSAPLALSS